MADDKTEARIIHSHNLVVRYEAMGGPPNVSVDMINQEIAIIEQIGVDHPETADMVGTIVKRWRKLKVKLVH